MRHVIGAAVTEDIDQAVIATPIRVAREQRIRTKLAAERAGAKSIRYSSASLRERLYFPKDAGNELHFGWYSRRARAASSAKPSRPHGSRVPRQCCVVFFGPALY
jgi:hypothetical protein